jgi:hypothetical protein
MFLDDDDEWCVEKIEKQVQSMSVLGPEWGAVTCLAEYRMRGRPLRRTLPYRSGNLHRAILHREVAILTPTSLIRKSAFVDCGGFDESLVRDEDVAMYLGIASKYSIFLIPEVLTIVNCDDNQNRPNGREMEEAKRAFLDRINTHLSRYSPSERRTIVGVHYSEVLYTYLKDKDLRACLRVLGIIRFDLPAYYTTARRLVDRIRQGLKGTMDQGSHL